MVSPACLCWRSPSFLPHPTGRQRHLSRKARAKPDSLLQNQALDGLAGPRLEAVSRLRPEALLPSWDRVDQPQTRPRTMFSLTRARLHHWGHSALGGCSGGGLQAKKVEVRRADSRCARSRLDSKGPTGGSMLQRVCSLICMKASAGAGSVREAPSAGSPKPLQGCGKRESVVVDEKKGHHLGPQVSRWHLGGEPGTPGLTAEPSGGVAGLWVKHQCKRAPTW